MLEFFWWGSVFLLALPVVAILYPWPADPAEHRDPTAGRLDLLSAALAVAGTLAVIFGLKQIAQDGISLLPIAVSSAGLVVGAIWVRRQTKLPDPMIDVGLFKRAGVQRGAAHQLPGDLRGSWLFPVHRPIPAAGRRTRAPGGGPVVAAEAIAFIVGSQLAPRIVGRIGTARLIGGGLALGAVGLIVLTQVPTTNGLIPLVVASVIISLGLAPVFGLTTELIVGSAPAERAGAASGHQRDGRRARRRAGPRAAGQHRRRDLPRRCCDGAACRDPGRGGRCCARHAGRRGGRGCDAARCPGRGASQRRTRRVRRRHARRRRNRGAPSGIVLAVFTFVSLRGREVGAASAEPEEMPVPTPVVVPTPARECF